MTAITVIPAEAGIHFTKMLDTHFRRAAKWLKPFLLFSRFHAPFVVPSA